MMNLRQLKMKRLLVFNSHRHGTYAKVKTAIGDCMEQMRHRVDPMELDEMAYPAEEECDR